MFDLHGDSFSLSRRSQTKVWTLCAALFTQLTWSSAAVALSDGTDSSDEESSSEAQEGNTRTGDGTDFFDFRCIHDGPRVNAEINYHKEGLPLPKAPTIVVDLDRTGCEVLGDEQGGTAYCRCSRGQLRMHVVPASSLPKLIHGTDDIVALEGLCKDQIRRYCGVEPKDPEFETGTDGVDDDSSSTQAPSTESNSQESDGTQDSSFPGTSTQVAGGSGNSDAASDHDADGDGKPQPEMPEMPEIPGCRSTGRGPSALWGLWIFGLLVRSKRGRGSR